MTDKIEVSKDHYEAIRGAVGSKEAEKFKPIENEESEPEEQPENISEESGESLGIDGESKPDSFEEIMTEDTETTEEEPEASGDSSKPGDEEAEGNSEEDEAVKSELDKLGVEYKKENDDILFKGKVDGEEVWTSLPEAIRKYQSDEAINRRFQEAAEKRKKAEELLEEAEKAQQADDQIQKFIDSVSAPGENDELDLLGESDSTEDSDLKQRIAELENRLQEEQKQKEAEEQKIREQQKKKNGMKKAFETVDAIIAEEGLYEPTEDEAPAVVDRIKETIASETGGYNEEYWKRIADPKEVFKGYKNACSELSLGNKKPSDSDDGGNPPVPPAGDGGSSGGVSAKLEKLKARRDYLRGYQDEVAGDKRTEAIIELKKINDAIKEASLKK